MRLPAALAAPAAFALLAACDGGSGPAEKVDIESEAAAEEEIAPVDPEAELVILNPEIRLPAASGRPGVGYFLIRGGGEDRVLTAVSTNVSQRGELHETVEEGGVARMKTLDKVAIPAGESVAFQRGGKHVMLHGIDPRWHEGQVAQMTFSFEDGETLTRDARVMPPADGPEQTGDMEM